MPHLPVELVRMIVLYVAREHKRLFPLLFVSKEFLHETSRIIYRCIFIGTQHKRHQLPLNNAAKRSYYASLVEEITIGSSRLYNDIRRILHAVMNLRHLRLLETDTSTLQYILRPDYPFRIHTFECRVTRNPRLTEFIESQPSIKTIGCCRSVGLGPLAGRDDLARSSSLPSLQNIYAGDALLSSELFEHGNIKRIDIGGEPSKLLRIPNEPTEASRRVVSLRLPAASARISVILNFFPNVQYLDGCWILVSLSCHLSFPY